MMWRWKWYEDDHLYIRGDNAYDVDNNDDHNANDDDIADSHNANDDDHPMLMMMNMLATSFQFVKCVGRFPR